MKYQTPIVGLFESFHLNIKTRRFTYFFHRVTVTDLEVTRHCETFECNFCNSDRINGIDGPLIYPNRINEVDTRLYLE